VPEVDHGPSIAFGFRGRVLAERESGLSMAQLSSLLTAPCCLDIEFIRLKSTMLDFYFSPCIFFPPPTFAHLPEHLRNVGTVCATDLISCWRN
jgi:hypothetical protein